MSADRVHALRRWHDRAYEMMRAELPSQVRFMGLDLHVPQDVFAPAGDGGTDPYHETVERVSGAGGRVLDMGTGSGISGLLAARAGCEVVAVDINPKAVECARLNAERNSLSARMTFVVSDVFDAVDGDFDLIAFDPPFRWFKPRDLLETSIADENYGTLARFMAQARSRLRPGGRVLLNFGTSGDFDYLNELIDRAGFRKDVRRYGEATRDGMTAEYFTIMLT